ncbi:sn-glycerol-3-phosphate ABC transporter ATP-binding protein UgpC [Candidatus Acetothermia bacterium]|jgi:multiple sugar transport system ATP-binding protein|nr:sn-glycerol-3-phosphate ABC transporter ATP-binding protein UgpC [Candidatus Acetothermia bacterium]MCI2427158.1 sn-glycerol-3-phosphate ABC transporter ATP-binding protein UgpC [Candidatus Acetothermia bacterium]MCI2428792.1 sn-glycerol-3-phosphate ABC transporter ATP-binding protein UgpC [Candidatus Acetothermia bacterium]
MAEVLLKGVTKKFGNFVAVDKLDLTINDGEFTVLVGPSGCGKTTTLRMIAGLEEITSGDIYIGDRLVNDIPPKDRDIAMVFQNYALYPHMDVYNNMAFGLKLRKTPKQEINRRVKEAAELLGITEKLKSKPRQLSGGQRQRVALGRAIVREPKVFLFDEPLSNLDAKLRVAMRAELQELHQKLKTTSIYVTHDQVEAMTLGQRVAVMNKAVLHQYDPPQQLYDYPIDQFVAGFIGSPAMNFFNARLTSESGILYVENRGFKLALPDRNQRIEYDSEDVVLGIRPEDLHGPVDSDDNDVIAVRVKVVEPLGDEIQIYADCSGQELVASLNPRQQIRVGDTIKLRVAMDYMHLFDPHSGRTIR